MKEEAHVLSLLGEDLGEGLGHIGNVLNNLMGRLGGSAHLECAGAALAEEKVRRRQCLHHLLVKGRWLHGNCDRVPGGRKGAKKSKQEHSEKGVG